MIENATVYLDNGIVSAEKVKFKDNGWIGVRENTTDWVYYPAHKVERIEA